MAELTKSTSLDAFPTPEATVGFTDQAAHKVWQLLSEENDFALKLRVYVTGGGCSGFRYGFAFEEAIAEDDVKVEKMVNDQPIVLLIDSLSYQYLVGAEIDYEEDIKGEQFVIRNPNAKTTCGCGSSFTTE